MRKTLILLASLIVALSSPLSAGTGFDPLLGRIVTVPPASRLSYSTSTSGLSEANVQGAIDELATMIADVTTGGLSDIDQLPGDTTDDNKIDLGLLTTTPSFESMTLTGAAGLTLGVAGTTQGALVIASNTHAVYKNTIVPGTMTESVSWRLPGAMPAGADYLVNCDVTTGQMGYTNPATFQAADADLTTWAGVTPSANGQSLVSAANYAAMRGLLDLEAGTDFNAYDYDLGTLASGITGIVKGGGNGGGFSAASAGTDYLAPTGSASQLTGYSTGAQPLDSDLTALAGISGQRGDVIYYGSAGWTRLAKGTENYVLTQGANDPAWAAATGGGASTLDDLTDAVITSAEQGDVLYFNGTNWVNLAHGSAGQYLKTGGNAANPSWDTPSGAGDMLASAYPAIAAIEGLNFADASIIQLTGADTSAVLTSGGNNYILGSNSDNSALEFKTPANVLSQIGAQAASAVLTTYAGINPTANVQTMLGSANNAAILSNIGAQTADSDLTTLSAPTAWRVFYSNGSQAVTELALGADGTFLESNGASAAPAFRTLALSDLPTITPSKGGTGVANNDASTLTISGNYATTLTVTGTTGVTLPTSGTLAALAGANTWTGNNTFGDGNGDTLTSRGIIVGGDRTGSNDAVQIAATLASPTYATGTNELYVAGDIETAGNVYANQFISSATGDSYVQLANNSGGLSGSGYRLWFETDTTDQLKYSINGTEKAVVNVQDAQTISGAKTLSSALTLNRGATGAGQLVISEDSDDGTNAVTITGQAMGSSYTLTLPADDGTNGQALVTNGSGVTSWGTVSATAGGSDTQVQFNDGGSALGGDAGFVFNKTTDTLTLGENSVDGVIVLYNESGATDYNLTIQPGTQSGSATITMPGSTATLATLGLAETLSGAKTFSANVTLDDGTGASPSFTFQDGTDETAVFSKVDAGYLTVTTVAGDGFGVLVGNLTVGNGSPGQTLNGEDAYIEGLLEVDGAAYLDGGVTVTGNLAVSGSVTEGAVASPNFIFKDSDNLGTDKECARIEANATTTTDGDEDGDLIFSVMQDGTVTPVLTFDESDDQWETTKTISCAGITIPQGATETSTTYYEASGNGTNKVTVKAPSSLAADYTQTQPSATGTYVLEDNTATLTGKTLDANATGNTLKGYGYITLRRPNNRGSATTAITTTETDINYGMPAFADDVEANNYIDYFCEVPRDIDTAVDLVAYFKFRLGGADTADHDYIVSMVSIADSAAQAGTPANAINLSYTADGSGASGDVETAGGNTLTAWKDNVTAGQIWMIRVTRDGDDGTNDASTVDSYPVELTIRYGFTQ